MAPRAQTTSDAVKPIRALLRGLDVLAALNARDGMVVSEVAQVTRLPRTTVYRVLETLVLGGYVVRDAEDDRYRPSLALDRLCDGARDDGWVADRARPAIHAKGREILWPLMLHTPDNGAMRLRVVTDRDSPYALRQHSPGELSDYTGSCAGIAALAYWLQHGTPADRNRARELIDAGKAKDKGADLWLEETRQHGYAIDLRARDGEGTLSLPLADDQGKLRAVLSLRFIRSAVSSEKVLGELREKLDLLAREIMGPMERLPASNAARRASPAAE